ncbi:plasmid stabilization protein [Streptomyces sp. NPDC097981]|uniref:plasmid stabilization protein n=1 Tax=Streptomyces sp. NPDC097981 TaxID=3155428 RepID=UPI0033167957
MPGGSSPERERQYEHIKESAQLHGVSEQRAKETEARTVDKERARAGEPETGGGQLLDGISSARRADLHSRPGAQGPTYEQLYAEARRRNIRGRSDMNKTQLKRALGA